MRQIFCFLTFTIIGLTVSHNSISQSAIQLQLCDVQGFKEKVKCGTFDVFENRNARKGRKISLKIVVAPATSPDRKPDPLLYIPGGPGSSSTEDAPGVAIQLANIREHRDLVFVDQRGTGGSNPLACTFYEMNDPQSSFGYFFPLEQVKKCRAELEQKADLTQYTTSIAMDDFDDVRAALGYDQINIFGGSYGTRASLVYLKQHPKSVRTITLQGVVPAGDYIPFDFARRSERALQGVIDECAADPDCNSAFPNLRTEMKAVLERLLQGPVETEITIPPALSQTGTAKTAKVKLSRDLAAEAIRYMLYSPGSAARVPLVLHQAATGNFAPLAQIAFRFRSTLVATGSNGMYLSVTCAEDLPWFKQSEAANLAANTFLGDYRVRQQLEACALWPRAKAQTDYAVRSSAPVLMLTGEWDPVTPPTNAQIAARSLPNSLQVVIPHGGHGFGGLDGLQCVQKLIGEFVEQGSAKNLDTTCVKQIKRRGFALK